MYVSGSISMKTLILPEWWLLWPMPAAFALVGVEFLFRMYRLAVSERRPRDERDPVARQPRGQHRHVDHPRLETERAGDAHQEIAVPDPLGPG